MTRSTLLTPALFLAGSLPASAASFALDIYDGDFTGNKVGQATLSTTTGYPQVDTPGTPAVVPQLDQYDFTLTVDSLDPGYSGVDALSIFMPNQGTVQFSPPNPDPTFLLVDPAITADCSTVDPAADPCTERPLTPESPPGWTAAIGFHAESTTYISIVLDPFTYLKASNVLVEIRFAVDDPANALAAGDSLSGFRWNAWSDAWDITSDDAGRAYTAARGLMATGEEPAPVPEPTAFTLVALGLAALLAARRNRHPNGQTR